jgi:hypothetical protein
MKNLSKLLSIILISSSINLQAGGPLVGGGGGALLVAQFKGQITINIDDISDIRLKNENIIPTYDFITMPSLNNSFKSLGQGQIMLDLSNKSQVLDVQLINGQIIDFSSLQGSSFLPSNPGGLGGS